MCDILDAMIVAAIRKGNVTLDSIHYETINILKVRDEIREQLLKESDSKAPAGDWDC